MKRILLDTSVYGELAEDKDTANSLAKLVPNIFIIYGNKVIRNELRETPKNKKYKDRSMRILLLNIFDSLTRDHNLKHNKLIDTLSKDYFIEYKKQGGSLSNEAMRKDLIIIATVTIYKLEVIISSDERSMLSNKALRAYRKVNKEYGLTDPIFKNYKKFKHEVRRLYQNEIS